MYEIKFKSIEKLDLVLAKIRDEIYFLSRKEIHSGRLSKKCSRLIQTQISLILLRESLTKYIGIKELFQELE
jgi:hypothetical protein